MQSKTATVYSEGEQKHFLFFSFKLFVIQKRKTHKISNEQVTLLPDSLNAINTQVLVVPLKYVKHKQKISRC